MFNKKPKEIELINEGYEEIKDIQQLASDILYSLSYKLNATKTPSKSNPGTYLYEFTKAITTIEQSVNQQKISSNNFKNFCDKFKNISITFEKASRDREGTYNLNTKSILLFITDEKELEFNNEFNKDSSKNVSAKDIFFKIHGTYYSILEHELQHVYDDYISKGQAFNVKQTKYEYDYSQFDDAKEYLNLPYEVNARFTQAINKINFLELVDFTDDNKQIERPYEFKKVLRDFLYQFPHKHLLNQNVKNTVIKRLYNIYNKAIEKAKTDDKIELIKESNSQLEDTFIKINSPNIKSHIDSLINKYGEKAEVMNYIKHSDAESNKPEYSISYTYCKKLISLATNLKDKHGLDKDKFELYGGFPLINYLSKELNNKRDIISRSKKTKTMAGFNHQYNKEHERVGLIKNGKKYVDRNLRECIELIKESEVKVNKEASCIVLLNEDKKILLLKRSDKTPWQPGKWSLVGGKIDLGENAKEAGIRECGEETGLGIKGNKLIYCFTMKEDDYEVNFFIGVSEGSDVRLNGEHTEYKWVNPNEIPELETVPNLLGEIKKCFETLETDGQEVVNEETVINEEMSSPTGLALYKPEGSNIFILYNPKTIGKALKDYDSEEAMGSVYGAIELRFNSIYDTYEVERVVANKGYGPIMYLIALQFAGPKGLTPTRIKNQVSDQAKNVWKQFFDGVGSSYTKPLDLVNSEDNTTNNSHNEEYLNKKYVLNKTYNDYNKMLNASKTYLKNDKYGEMGGVIFDAGDTTLTRKIREIYPT